MLAKAMGFHQTGQGSSLLTLSPEETEERQKIFRSLYIRDRCSAVLRGSPTWISPSSHCLGSAREPQGGSVPYVSPLGSGSSAYERNKVAWCDLTTLQGELHHLIFASQGSISESRALLARIAQDLEAWSQKHGVPSKSVPLAIDEVSLHLAFLGTRIRVIEARKACEKRGAVDTQALHDARLSSLLLLILCSGKRNDRFAGRASTLLSHDDGGRMDHAAESTRSEPPSPATKVPFAKRQPPDAVSPSACSFSWQDSQPQPHPIIGIHRLAIAYPAIAPFILARNILEVGAVGRSVSPSEDVESGLQERQDEGDEDRELLQALAACFRDAPALQHSGPDNHAAQVGRVIGCLVDIVSLDGKYADHEDVLPANSSDVLPSAAFPLWNDSNGTSPSPPTPTALFGSWVDVLSGISDTQEPSLSDQWTDPGSSVYFRQPFNKVNHSTVSLPDVVPTAPAFGAQPMEHLGAYPVDTMWGQHGHQFAALAQQQPNIAADTCRNRRVKRLRKEFIPDT